MAIIADTHIPSRASELPRWVEDELERASVVIHAGDFDSVPAYEHIDALADELIAVTGNTDPELGLPSTRQYTCEDCSFVITHGTGPLDGYRTRVLETVRSVDQSAVAVAGHTHDPTDEHIDGHRFLNPGSATGAAPAGRATMLVCEVGADTLDVTALEGP